MNKFLVSYFWWIISPIVYCLICKSKNKVILISRDRNLSALDLFSIDFKWLLLIKFTWKYWIAWCNQHHISFDHFQLINRSINNFKTSNQFFLWNIKRLNIPFLSSYCKLITSRFKSFLVWREINTSCCVWVIILPNFFKFVLANWKSWLIRFDDYKVEEIFIINWILVTIHKVYFLINNWVSCEKCWILLIIKGPVFNLLGVWSYESCIIVK